MYKPAEVMVPPVADHVTALFVVPVTVAVNCCVPPVSTEAEVGEMVIETTGVALTVTAAEADLVGSATLVAVTLYVPEVEGAVYRPLAKTVPPVADQIKALFMVPLTVAVNCWVCPACTETEEGDRVTVTTGVVAGVPGQLQPVSGRISSMKIASMQVFSTIPQDEQPCTRPCLLLKLVRSQSYVRLNSGMRCDLAREPGNECGNTAEEVRSSDQLPNSPFAAKFERVSNTDSETVPR